MVNNELFVEALRSVEKLHMLTERRKEETRNTRFIALYELTRKIRASFNALHFIPYEQYEFLCAPTNLLYRSMITDFMTSLLISQVDNTTLEDVIYYFDFEFTKSLKSALDANIEIRTMTYPDDADAFEEQKMKYQEKLYDDLKDYLSSAKGEEWKPKRRKPIKINNKDFEGKISQMYDILKSFEEVSGFAYIYQYYRLFSQSEHFSVKGSIMNHKQDFHDNYYNKVLGLIYLGEKYIYDRYINLQFEIYT